ncbi:hypothetical protein BCD67_23035 [Oscillatoriales cyanobacterium USR001]|nr:hypothetical protein BCD67_23035 [Oscillatoriales cyanobacterium USR001]
MKTATLTRRSNLQILEENLQAQLQEVGFKDLPLQINCSAIEETLLIVAEHPPSLTLKPEPTFAALHSAILKLQPKGIQQVGICLKLTEQKQPYTFYSFGMNQSVSSRFDAAKRRDKNSSAIVPVSFWKSVEETLAVKLEIPGNELNSEAENISLSSSSTSEESSIIATGEDADLSENPFDANDLDLTTKKSFHLPASSWLWLVGAGAVTALLLSFYYFFTRPCVIGTCTAMATAEQLNQESVKTLKAKKTVVGVKEAKGKINQAIAQLETIPFWSPNYDETKKILQDYREKNQTLNSVIIATNKGNLAAVKSKNPPHNAQTWSEVKSLWQGAIAPLEKISKSSPIYPFAQQKLKEYQGNLATANKRLLVEQEAENILNQAQTLAKVTEARTGVAQSVESWEKIESNWENVVSTIDSISQGTTAYDRAKVLLKDYERKLARSRDRKTIEKIAEDSYTQGITSAAQARIFQDRKQWTQASEYWQKALTAIQEVPSTTSYYVKARPLVNSFKDSLQKVEAKLVVEKILLKAGSDLDKVCNVAPKVCEFTVSDELIIVQMTPDYVQKLQQTFIKAGNKDTKTRQAVEKHLQTLQAALETISNNAGVPLKLYDDRGKVIGTHGVGL